MNTKWTYVVKYWISSLLFIKKISIDVLVLWITLVCAQSRKTAHCLLAWDSCALISMFWHSVTLFGQSVDIPHSPYVTKVT